MISCKFTKTAKFTYTAKAHSLPSDVFRSTSSPAPSRRAGAASALGSPRSAGLCAFSRVLSPRSGATLGGLAASVAAAGFSLVVDVADSSARR